MNVLSTLFGDPNKKVIDVLRPIVAKINALEEQYLHRSNDELKNDTLRLREIIIRGDKTLDDILPEAFALCREGAKRAIGQRHIDLQLMGGIVMHRGQIAEMRTGEGKTLTATLAVFLNALSGKGVHVVTVNDYLAKRDAVWMGRVYHALGLSVGCIQHDAAYLYDPDYSPPKDDEESEAQESYRIEYGYLRPCSRKEAYAADITYGTNNEYGFDYLRDNLVASLNDMAQREMNFAIVDEVDSILIDEARTPLIISAPAAESAELYYTFAKLVSHLKEMEDYNVDEKMRAATLTEEGLHKMEQALGIDNVYTSRHVSLVHHMEQALRAHTLFKRDRDYVVKDGEVVIVDEFTGRLMHGRRYSEGLHQAIEAQEGVKVQRESQTYATITFQNYFRMYRKLSGMTGTAATEAEEFSKIYKLEVVTIPTHREAVRADLPDQIYKNEHGKYAAVVAEIKQRNATGQPVLVGTISIEKNEILGALLEREGIPHNILNAKNHEREAEIIAQAGRRGGVTIATNMAGRGVDIILGGNPSDEDEMREVRKRGGLHVIGTERHESRRIDNQLRGRSGRQGDPGSTQFFISLEDDLMRIFGSDRIKGLMDKFNFPDDMPIEHGMISKAIEEAQKKVEGHNFDTRKHVVEYDDVINKHREIIYKRRRDILDEFDRELKNLAGQEVLDQPSDTEESRAIDDSLDETESKKEHQGKKTLKQIILDMIEQEIEHVVMFHTQNDDEDSWNIQEIYEVVSTIFPLSSEDRKSMEDIHHTAGDKLADVHARTRLIEYLLTLEHTAYENFEKRITDVLAKTDPTADPSVVLVHLQKDLLVRTTDNLWVGHLEAVEHMRTGIGLRGYGQRDPLVEYKKESYRMFTELMAMITKQVAYTLFKIGGVTEVVAKDVAVLPQNALYTAPEKTSDVAEGHTHIAGGQEKIGRNDPCPCGAKKANGDTLKYKHCHGKNS
ncbi:MAG: preprotein translocase subunit SecA [Candidatus Uhrbacteria bacterium]|nr:preprotein translocase subunit SecA [Candidatus Uhrbacteria bacterium]